MLLWHSILIGLAAMQAPTCDAIRQQSMKYTPAQIEAMAKRAHLSALQRSIVWRCLQKPVTARATSGD